jgi:hypothetical protein
MNAPLLAEPSDGAVPPIRSFETISLTDADDAVFANDQDLLPTSPPPTFSATELAVRDALKQQYGMIKLQLK